MILNFRTKGNLIVHKTDGTIWFYQPYWYHKSQYATGLHRYKGTLTIVGKCDDYRAMFNFSNGKRNIKK